MRWWAEEVAVYILYIYTTLGINYDVIYPYFLVAKSQNPSATLASFLIRTPRHGDVAFWGRFCGARAIETFKRYLRTLAAFATYQPILPLIIFLLLLLNLVSSCI